MNQFSQLSILSIFVFLINSAAIISQPIYGMQNKMVNDCEGILMDSQNGPEPDQYDHNENYIFVVCIPDADEIILNFGFFATEETYDVLTIYEGPDTTGNIIAILDGVLQPAPSFIVKNECVTFHFVSDDNILANGWTMTWESIIDDPEIPSITVEGNLDCPMKSAIFSFDLPIDCDLFDASNFNLIGPGNNQIESVIALDCDPVTNKAQRFEIIFVDSLKISGTYRLSFTGRIQDACGEWHDIGSTLTFNLSGCPIVLDVEVVVEACAGDCATIKANILGGNPNDYRFEWSHTPLKTQEVEICVDDTATIMVTATNQNSLKSTTTIYVYIPLAIPDFLNKLGLDTFCSDRSNYQYQVDIPGGEFYSRVIPSWERSTGRYQFWRWNSSSLNIEQDIIEYIAPNGCIARDTFWVRPIYVGTHEAACIGSAPFLVNGGTPKVGTWSGNHISGDGTFDPTETGTFSVTFTAPNGCMRSKNIVVTDTIIMPDIDTVCGGGRIEIRAVPFGGRWSGPRVQNNYLGRIDAHLLAPNQSYKYYYDLKGCRDSIELYVEAISAGSNRTFCTDTDTLKLTATGTWTGPGIYLPVQNAFDVSNLGVGRYTYNLEKNGCTDRFTLTIIEVAITEYTELDYCQNDEWIKVLDLIDISPVNGNLVAPFLKDSMSTKFFNPSKLSIGPNLIELQSLGCSDSMWINIEGPAAFPEFTFCEFDNAVNLTAIPDSGIWSGPGIIDPIRGLFDPLLVGVGNHIVTYQSPLGCITNDTVEVFAFREAEISGLDQVYCFTDTIIDIITNPPGGTLTINGQSGSTSFNPTVLGSGVHEIYYQSGTGKCESNDRVFITILFPLSGSINAKDDSICLGESTVIDINPTGGIGIPTSTWSQGLGFGTSHIISPQTSTWYAVNVKDGCSEPLVDSIFIFVHPEFKVDIIEGPEVCFDEITFAEIVPPNDGNYLIEWLNDSITQSSIYYGHPGPYTIRVTKLESGCSEEFNVNLPGGEPLKANFATAPTGRCIDIINNEIEIIDLATGYTEGTIDFGDNSDTQDLLNDILINSYNEHGEYKITQIIKNDLGCIDSFSIWICVENNVRVFIPNIFTPNGDDNNDIFQIHSFGIENIDLKIFNRFGEIIFGTNDIMDTWDGTFQGKEVNPGAFVLIMSYKDKETGFPYLITRSLTLIR